MDKKQRITWGVSFGSLALVAGMTAYLGLGNGNNSHNGINQNQQSGYFSRQDQNTGQSYNDSSPFDSNNGSFNQNFGDDSSNFDQSSGGNDFTQGYGNSNGRNQFSNGGPSFGGGHHHGFDTTTGGT